jgi:hypothetical protein
MATPGSGRCPSAVLSYTTPVMLKMGAGDGIVPDDRGGVDGARGNDGVPRHPRVESRTPKLTRICLIYLPDRPL